MILKHKIFEKYGVYRFNMAYKTGDKVLVKKGDKIKDGDELMKKINCNIKHSFYLPEQIDVPLPDLSEYINCIDGEFVNKGSVLAEKVVGGGLVVKKLVSPSPGVIDLSRIGKGFLDLLGEEKETLVKSSFKGIVEDVNPIDGIAILSTSYALDLLAISDVSLSRAEQSKKIIGEIFVLGEGKDLLLHTDDADYEDKIVFVGRYLHPKLLHNLFEKGASFVLTYSMDYEDFKMQGLPVGVIGGFGEIHSSKNILDLITSMNGKFAIVDYSENQVFFVTDDNKQKNREDMFVKSAVGNIVLSRSLSNYGMLGKIISIEEENFYATVEWEGGQRSMINLGNVEFVSF